MLSFFTIQVVVFWWSENVGNQLVLHRDVDNQLGFSVVDYRCRNPDFLLQLPVRLRFPNSLILNAEMDDNNNVVVIITVEQYQTVNCQIKWKASVTPQHIYVPEDRRLTSSGFILGLFNLAIGCCLLDIYSISVFFILSCAYVDWLISYSVGCLSHWHFARHILVYWFDFDFWCFKATFNNISAISWRPVWVVEEAGVARGSMVPR